MSYTYITMYPKDAILHDLKYTELSTAEICGKHGTPLSSVSSYCFALGVTLPERSYYLGYKKLIEFGILKEDQDEQFTKIRSQLTC